MPFYRVYLLEQGGGIVRSESAYIYAETEDEALHHAKAHAHKSAVSWSGLEIWLGSRRIASWKPDGTLRPLRRRKRNGGS